MGLFLKKNDLSSQPEERSMLGSADSWSTSSRVVTRQQLPQLLDQYRPHLKRIAEKEVPSYISARFDSSDVVQETLMRAYQQFDQFRGQTDLQFAAWMRGILLNQIVDALRFHARVVRNQARDRNIPESLGCQRTLTGSDEFRRAELRERLQLALRQLPDEYQTVLKLRQEDDLSFAEIGQKMNRSSNAARMLWGRALLMLAKCLKAVESGRH